MSVWNFSSIQSLSCVQLSSTPGTAARQASLSITNSHSLLKLMSIESVMPSNHLILCRPLLFLPSIFPSIRVFSDYETDALPTALRRLTSSGSFQMSQLFASGGKSIGASALALVLPVNIQD